MLLAADFDAKNVLDRYTAAQSCSSPLHLVKIYTAKALPIQGFYTAKALPIQGFYTAKALRNQGFYTAKK